MKRRRGRPGGDFKRRTPVKNKVVIDMLNRALDKGPMNWPLRGLAQAIEYDYPHVWEIYNERRNMPLEPLIKLCMFLQEIPHEKVHEEAFKIWRDQPKPPAFDRRTGAATKE